MIIAVKLGLTALAGSSVVTLVAWFILAGVTSASTATSPSLWFAGAGILGGFVAGYLVGEPVSGAINGGIGAGAFGILVLAIMLDAIRSAGLPTDGEFTSIALSVLGVLFVTGVLGGGLGGRLHSRARTSTTDATDIGVDPRTELGVKR